MNSQRNLAIKSLDILALSSFAFAQPLFDLLSRNAGFFVARKSEPLDIILFVLGLCLIPPTVFVVFESVPSAIWPKFQKEIHAIVIAFLVATILLPPLKRMGAVPGKVWIVLAILLGVAFSAAWLRFRTVRSFLVFLSPAALLFPVLFVFNSPIHKLIFGAKNPSITYPKVNATVPLVMVVFDEFPLASLLDETRHIDPKLYPNFAALSRSATWYRNATAVSEGTLNAVPSLVDGLYPRTNLQLLPNATDHPHTLFTLLGGSYKLNVVENNTRLCPEPLCGSGKTFLSQRMRGLWSDLGVLFLYILLPSELTTRLPDITQSWKDFKTDQVKQLQPKNPLIEYDQLTDWKDRPGVFKRFVESIQPSSQPTLHFLHILLPHAPWEYLPSGKKNTLEPAIIWGAVGNNDKGADPTQWTDNKWAVIQAYQRHLLQVGLVDHLLGYLLEHLKNVGLYDPFLVVITADHGASFRPNESRRTPSRTNYPDIMAIPLFIKAPYQVKGRVDDRNVETIDILPTIADILKIDTPWKIDGRSALNGSLPEKAEKVIIVESGEKLVFDSSMGSKYETVIQKLKLFGSGNTADRLFKIGPNAELIGHQVADLAPADDLGTECDLDGDSYFNHVDPGSPILLTNITGRIFRSHQGTHKPLSLAIAVNGTIRAMTETYMAGNDERFSALVPDSAFHPGHNGVNAFVVSNSNGRLVLERLPTISIPEYRWGDLLYFGTGGNGASYQAEGWGTPEQYFTWIDGKRARLVLPTSVPDSPVILRMRLRAFLALGKVTRQKVRVLVNHQMVGEWLITNRNTHERSLTLPKELFADSRETVITFEVPEAVAPASVGAGIDIRELSIAIAWIRLDKM